jgi:predicted transcriptional regulator YdeE
VSFTLQKAKHLTVLGIYARASNADPQNIGILWRKFQAMGSAGAIEARSDDAVYCVYCEYESDFNGAYTVLIGCAVDAAARVPEGMKKIRIEAGKFAVFEPAGELPTSVIETYQADFERYGGGGKVTVHVGVR